MGWPTASRGGTKRARSGAAGRGGGRGGCGNPTCELAAQQLHPEGAVPPAHLGVQPHVLRLDGRREGVGVRGVVVHVPTEHLQGSKVCTKKCVRSLAGVPCPQSICVVLTVHVRFSPNSSRFSTSSARHKFFGNVLPLCHIVASLPPVPSRGLVTPRN